MIDKDEVAGKKETNPSAQMRQMRRSAMDLLARREHSGKELLVKLGRKYSLTDESPEWAQLRHEIERLGTQGLQSDTRMSENFVRSRARKGQGPLKIRLELRSKGVDDHIIDEAMLSAETNWNELAGRVIVKRFGETTSADLKEKAKRVRFLQQRGFGFEHFEKLV